MFMQTEAPVNGAELVQQAEPVQQSVQNAAANVWSRLTDGDITSSDLSYAFTEVGLPIIKAIVLILVVLFVARWAKQLTIKAATKAKVETTLAKFFGNLARWAVLIMGGISILGTFGIEATSFAAVVAALGFAIGMALSGTIGNVAAGVMLLIFRPYKVGDVVSVGGVTGKVHEIDLFTTTFDTPDNRRIIVPNGQIFGTTIENITYHGTRRVDVAVGTEYSADLNLARSTLLAAAKSVEGVLPEPEPVAYLKELGGSSIDWAVRVWANTPDYWAVRERLTQAVKEHLDNAGVGIPFPQMDVHLDKVEA